MLKRTISLSLLCMASHAYSANIIVTTTADENGENPNACSLREAIQLINGELITDPADENKKIYKDLLNSTEGFGGCGGKDAVSDVVYVSVIELPLGKTYLLEDEVEIRRSLTLRSDDLGNSRDLLGVNNPVIRAVGASPHRLFNIDDDSPEATSIQSVVIQQVNLEGCAKTDPSRICEDNGGIISNNESLLLSSLRVSGGHARLFGGAVYSTTPQSSVALTIVDMQNNTAPDGAALYFDRPNFSIGGSYFSKNNTPSGSTGVVIRVKDGTQQNDSAGQPVTVVTTRSGSILSSTFYQNDAAVIDLREGIVINNTTMVDNRAGVLLIAPRGGANLANSIVAGNKQFDCQFNTADQTYLNNNLFINGCDDTLNSLQTSQIKISGAGDTALFAEQVNGQCAKPPARGLLCRPQPVATTPVELQDGTEVFNPYLRPRLLTEYLTLSDSKIVNKGRSISAIQQALTCTQNDQRGFERTLCDIGAIELVIDNNRKTNGLDIRFGGIAQLSLAPLLGDGDLIPADVCPSIFPNRQPEGGVWLEGCLTYTKAPQKGLMTLGENGEIIYRPSSNFHGVDRFNYDVVTTTSRFSDGANDRKIKKQTTIVQEPIAGDSNRKVNLAGGAFGWVGLCSLFGLAAVARRKTQKYKTKQRGAC